MLEVSHLAVDHGQLRALWDVSFRVGEGERVALLGANGAGKSTTLGAIIGLYPPAGGSIRYRDKDVGGRDTTENVENGIALVPEGLSYIKSDGEVFRLLLFQDAQQHQAKAVYGVGRLTATGGQSRRLQGKVGAVGQRVSIDQNQF